MKSILRQLCDHGFISSVSVDLSSSLWKWPRPFVSRAGGRLLSAAERPANSENARSRDPFHSLRVGDSVNIFRIGGECPVSRGCTISNT